MSEQFPIDPFAHLRRDGVRRIPEQPNPLDALEPDPQRSMPEDEYLAAVQQRLAGITQQHRKQSDYALVPPQEDSGNEDPIDIPETLIAWSARQLEDIRTRSLTDEQVIALATASAALAAVEQQARTAAALERLGSIAQSLSESMAAAVGTPTPIQHESPPQSRTERPEAHSEEQP